MFLKRLSRGSRANSYADEDFNDRPRSGDFNAQQDSPRQSVLQHNTFPDHHSGSPVNQPVVSNHTPPTMYRSQLSQEPYSQRGGPPNGSIANSRQNSAAFEASPTQHKFEAIPDPLTRAFNEALRPHIDKLEQLEAQVAELQAYADQLESQRSEIFQWIDKRGLRPDVPPSIAKAMDEEPESAAALNAQLDRKITIVNFDLHRLQDDLNDTISSSHFASAMSKFLPDITRLSTLPGGARYAFDLILKLGGNLNSHGGLDAATDSAEANADLAARRDFYGRLDTAMVDVVRRRFQENEEWAVGREIKRIEKTAAYLRNYGIEPYFPATLDTMKREVDFRNAGPLPPAPAAPPVSAAAQNSPKY